MSYVADNEIKIDCNIFQRSTLFIIFQTLLLYRYSIMVVIVVFFNRNIPVMKVIRVMGNHVVEQKFNKRYLIEYLIFILIRKW